MSGYASFLRTCFRSDGLETSVTQFVDDVVQQEADAVEQMKRDSAEIARSVVEATQVEEYVDQVVSHASAQMVEDGQGDAIFHEHPHVIKTKSFNSSYLMFNAFLLF